MTLVDQSLKLGKKMACWVWFSLAQEYEGKKKLAIIFLRKSSCAVHCNKYGMVQTFSGQVSGITITRDVLYKQQYTLMKILENASVTMGRKNFPNDRGVGGVSTTV